MVKYIFLLVLIFSLSSCALFFLTPFPSDLIHFKDSVVVDGIAPFHSTRLYVLDDNYVFLYVDEMEGEDKLFIYTTNLDPVYFYNINYSCNTFAVKESSTGYYCIGKDRIEITGNTINILNQIAFNGGTEPPDGFGFSYYGINYYLWWESENHNLFFRRCTTDWGFDPDLDTGIYKDDYNELHALYYDRDRNHVIMFFDTGEDEIRVVNIPVTVFTSDTNPDYDYGKLFDENSVILSDINPKLFYYTGDGYVIFDEHDTYFMYDLEGDLKAELYVGEINYSESYSQDGKTRFLFSETYHRLIKTEVWWKWWE